MNLLDYRERQRLHLQNEPIFRRLCNTCLQPNCYCQHIKKFDAKIKFVILIHNLEFRRRVATGRMSHLCLENSSLIPGYTYTNHDAVNSIITDAKNYCVVLYPGAHATNLTSINGEQRSNLIPKDKQLVVFVADGTWSTASKMVRRSENLLALPQICFTPSKASNFRVRKQPESNFYSTIEAIHEVIELLGESRGFDIQSRAHDGLIYVFNKMVEKQLEYQNELKPSRHVRNSKLRATARIPALIDFE